MDVLNNLRRKVTVAEMLTNNMKMMRYIDEKIKEIHGSEQKEIKQ